MAIRDDREHIRVLLYSILRLLQGGGPPNLYPKACTLNPKLYSNKLLSSEGGCGGGDFCGGGGGGGGGGQW